MFKTLPRNPILLIKFISKNGFHRAAFELLALKAAIKVVLAGDTVAMVTYWVTKMIPTWSSIVWRLFYTKSGYYDPSKS